MNRFRQIAGLLGVAAVAFVAGRVTLDIGAPSAAIAAQSGSKKETQPPAAAAEMDPEMAARMEAMMKAGTPGEHHKKLEPLVGTFKGEVSMRMDPDGPPMEGTGTINREWILDGRYIHERIDGGSDWGAYQGIGAIGYNNIDGQYEFAWIDSHSTAINHGTGIYDAAKKQLLTRGSVRDPASGHLIATRGVIDLSNPDRHVYAEYTYDDNGREFKMFEGVFERVKNVQE